VCAAGACVGGPPPACDDQNVCTVDACEPAIGCVNQAGNAGAICRGAANVCDTAETCTGASTSCPGPSDARAPALGPGTNQTVVGTCTAAPLAFATPALTSAACEAGTTVNCTTVPGNSYGVHAISCTASDAAGNVSAPVTFKVTVLQPLEARVQPPLQGDNGTFTNVVKGGSTVPAKVQLFACGVNVTKSARVTAKLAVSYVQNGGPSAGKSSCADTGGAMKLDGSHYQYKLSTRGYLSTASNPAYYQLKVTVAYQSNAGVVVGSNAIKLDVK
jgi:hypothetical protein